MAGLPLGLGLVELLGDAVGVALGVGFGVAFGAAEGLAEAVGELLGGGETKITRVSPLVSPGIGETKAGRRSKETAIAPTKIMPNTVTAITMIFFRPLFCGVKLSSTRSLYTTYTKSKCEMIRQTS